MFCLKPKIVFQEVPDEISIVFPVSGCDKSCPGCHSPELQLDGSGFELTDHFYQKMLEKYKDFVSCVCFFGGEWEKERLVHFLKSAHKKGLKTCLYTGSVVVHGDIYQELDYIKTGSWNKKKGGLSNPKSNQNFINVKTGELLNYKFWK